MSNKTSFAIDSSRLASIKDPQRNYLWQIYIPNIQLLSTSNLLPLPINLIDEDDVTIRCRTVTIPGGGFEKVETNFLGFKQYFPIKIKQTSTIVTELEEFEDQKVSKLLYNWKNKIINQDPLNPTAGNASPLTPFKKAPLIGYTRNIHIRCFTYDGEELDQKIIMHNSWPENVEDVSLSYGNSESVKYHVTWAFDYWKIHEFSSII